MNKPLVSVIIPTFNRGKHILNAVKTVEQQTYENVETVIVVDGSTDDTLKTLTDYKASLPPEHRDRLQIVYQDNKGVSAARNEAVRNASGQYIALLDDDDFWHPEKLTEQMEEVQKHPSNPLLICTTDHEEINPDGSKKEIQNSGYMSLEGQLEGGRFSPSITWILPRQTIEDIGGFDEELHAGEDADFIIRLRKNGEVIFTNVPKTLATYNTPPEGKIYKKQALSAARTLEKHGDWYAETYPEAGLQTTMAWYKAVLPKDLVESAATKLTSPTAIAALKR